MENTYTVKLPTLEDMNSFVNICSQFEENIDYRIGRYIVDAKSVMGIMSTTLGREANVTIHTDNSRIADSFVDHIYKWIVGDF